MPILIADKLEEVNSLCMVEIPYEVSNMYPLIFKAIERGLHLKGRVYLSRFYNEKGKVIKEYKQLFVLPIKKISYTYYLDLTRFHLQDGIPVGYIVEFLLLGLISVIKDKVSETPIFPNEFRVKIDTTVPDKVKESIEMERNTLEQIGRDVEVIGILYDANLQYIASDLIEALTRFYIADYEGSIKFFRKVVEGLRNYVQDKGIKGMHENRLKLLRAYLSKAFQLISNFGEHSGTYGFMPEAIFSKDIAISACKYVTYYLR